MSKTHGWILGISMTLAGIAAADDAPPLPPAGFVEFTKLLSPSMRCDMKWTEGFFGPGTPASTGTAAITFKQLNPSLFSIHFVQGKPGSPTALDLWEFFSHDGTRFDRVLYDSAGGMWHGTAERWEGAVLRFVSDRTLQCEKKTQNGALTITRRGPKEFGFQVQTAGADGTWIDLGGGSCR